MINDVIKMFEYFLVVFFNVFLPFRVCFVFLIFLKQKTVPQVTTPLAGNVL